jgi:hypothetical protein
VPRLAAWRAQPTTCGIDTDFNTRVA